MMALIEFYEEDMSPSGLDKIREATAVAYPEDAETIKTTALILWPRPLMVVEGAVFGGLDISGRTSWTLLGEI